MNSLYLIFVFVASLSFGQKRDSIIFYDEYNSDLKVKPKIVSFEKLIAKPNKYHKKVVKIYGFLSLNPKSSIHSFYQDRHSFLQKNTEKEILYSQFFEDSNEIIKYFNNNYVYITARFGSNVTVNDKKYIGTLINIVKVENTPKVVHCR